jgi:hypothetical protein
MVMVAFGIEAKVGSLVKRPWCDESKRVEFDRAIHFTTLHIPTPRNRPLSIQTRCLSANTPLLPCIVHDLVEISWPNRVRAN